MRRIVFCLASVLAAATLSACSGGGSVLSTTDNAKPTGVVVSVNGPVNVARVLPGAGVSLSAVQVNGSGILSGNNYRWSAALTTGGQYVADSLGHTKPCASVMLQTGGTTTPYTADFNIYIAIDPVNEANIIFFPPTILPAVAGSTVVTNYPYCVTVSAQPGKISGTGLGTTFSPTGPAGSITVAVVDPQSPLQ